MRPLCAHYVPTMCHNRCRVQSIGLRWAHHVPTMRSRCANYVFKPLGVQSMVPKCDEYAPTMRSLCLPSVCKRVRGSIDAPTVWQPCARYALSMCPLCVEGVLGFNPLAHDALTARSLFVAIVSGFNRRAHSAAIKRPLCAHHAPSMCVNDIGVRSMSP